MTKVSVSRASSSNRVNSADDRASPGHLQPEHRGDLAQTYPADDLPEPAPVRAFLRYFPQALAAERKVMPRRDEVVAWMRDAGVH
jgi:hypothetical protein